MNRCAYIATLVLNLLIIILSGFVLALSLISTPLRGNLGENLSTTYFKLSGYIFAFASSVKMFIMSEKDHFYFEFSVSKLLTRSKSLMMKCGCILMTALYFVPIMAFAVIVILEDFTLKHIDSCYKSMNITGEDCVSALQAFCNLVFEVNNYLIPVYISAYTYLIGREFAVLHSDMENSSHNDFECFRLRYNDLCRRADIFAENHGILLAFSLTFLTIGLVTCGYNFFVPFIPAKYMWSTTVLVSVTMFVLYLGPVSLLNQAKKPMELLSNVDMKTASEKKMIQMQMFMESIRNYNGILVAGFMSIDKAGALGIIGVVVTYVLVVVQYQPV